MGGSILPTSADHYMVKRVGTTALGLKTPSTVGLLLFVDTYLVLKCVIVPVVPSQNQRGCLQKLLLPTRRGAMKANYAYVLTTSDLGRKIASARLFASVCFLLSRPSGLNQLLRQPAKSGLWLLRQTDSQAL